MKNLKNRHVTVRIGEEDESLLDDRSSRLITAVFLRGGLAVHAWAWMGHPFKMAFQPTYEIYPKLSFTIHCNNLISYGFSHVAM
jgi:hypothetical protein